MIVAINVIKPVSEVVSWPSIELPMSLNLNIIFVFLILSNHIMYCLIEATYQSYECEHLPPGGQSREQWVVCQVKRDWRKRFEEMSGRETGILKTTLDFHM